MAWRWVRYQPDSALSKWFEERTAGAKGRMRRVMIVALARKLLIALWRFCETGLVPSEANSHDPIESGLAGRGRAGDGRCVTVDARG